MGLDGDSSDIIREIVQFLESLYDVDLPSKIENARIDLLEKSKARLSTRSSSARGSASPEPYLDMNAGKGFLLFNKKKNRDAEIEEYVGLEEKNPELSAAASNQDYYESFQEIGGKDNGDCPGRRKSWRRLELGDEQLENKLREIRRTFTAAKTSSEADKCGPLYYKTERKPFGFVRGNIRLCWIGLVGTCLVIHASEDDKQPLEVCWIRGYSARPAPNSVSRDPERAKSAFEIFSPGNKTLQFIAKTPEEMEEWMRAISRTSANIRPEGNKKCADELAPENAREAAAPSTDEKYQDVGPPPIPTTPDRGPDDCQKIDATRNSMLVSSPPVLPARTVPRRLPSLPNDEIPAAASYEPLNNDYEEDDIYHRIEDFRDDADRSYENVKKSKGSKKLGKKKKRKRKKEMATESETREENGDGGHDDNADDDDDDDAESRVSTKKKNDNGETYDDVKSIVRDKDCSSFESYDDVFRESAPATGRNADSRDKKKLLDNLKDCKRTKTEKSPEKSPGKRSFLDRVRHRKDSSKKSEKKRSKESSIDEEETKDNKGETIVPTERSETKFPDDPDLDLPTYDDVSQLINGRKIHAEENTANPSLVPIRIDESSDYNCPPPPRPIYSKPPSPAILQIAENKEDPSMEQVYDDIGNYLDEGIAEEMVEKNSEDESLRGRRIIGDTLDSSVTDGQRISVLGENDGGTLSESEHYQTPRRDSLRVGATSAIQDPEELYDDVAILADFRSRRRDSSSALDSPNKAGSASPEKPATTVLGKKPWNRFGSVKKISSRDSRLSTQVSPIRANDKSPLDLDDASPEATFTAAEKHETTKFNKLQKLINKMECTLGKQSSSKQPVAP